MVVSEGAASAGTGEKREMAALFRVRVRFVSCGREDSRMSLYTAHAQVLLNGT